MLLVPVHQQPVYCPPPLAGFASPALEHGGEGWACRGDVLDCLPENFFEVPDCHGLFPWNVIG